MPGTFPLGSFPPGAFPRKSLPGPGQLLAYTTPVIDIGSDLSVIVDAVPQGVGGMVLTMQTGLTSDGAPVGSYGALGPITARYLKVRLLGASVSPKPKFTSLVTTVEAA